MWLGDDHTAGGFQRRVGLKIRRSGGSIHFAGVTYTEPDQSTVREHIRPMDKAVAIPE